MSSFLSFNNFGRYGRLGNMMFQYASTLGIARKNNMSPICNISATPLFDKCFTLGGVTDGIVTNTQTVSENHFSFDSTLFDLQWRGSDHYDLIGYCQSEKYWKHCEDEIRQNFTFSDEVRGVASDMLPEGVLVSVHVRRGDYTAISDYHTNLAKEYYDDAMSMFPDYIPVFFSDDIKWCMDTFSSVKSAVFMDHGSRINLDPRVTSDGSAYVDMCCMSMCNAHIIANSSMSWWGAYLGRGKTVAPKTWFGPKGPQDWHDIYPDYDWTLL